MAKVPIFEDLFEQRVLVQRSSMVQDQLLIQHCALLIANENKGTTEVDPIYWTRGLDREIRFEC